MRLTMKKSSPERRAEWLKACSFKCPDDLREALDAAAKATGYNRSELIVLAIRGYFPQLLDKIRDERVEEIDAVRKSLPK